MFASGLRKSLARGDAAPSVGTLMLMSNRVRLSLANKCQLLFGLAVVLILTAALVVVWQRMQWLVEHQPLRRAQDYAASWLADEIQLGGSLTTVPRLLDGLPADADLTLALVEPEDFEWVSKRDAFAADAIEHFQSGSNATEQFTQATDEQGLTYYRYARAIRKSDLSRLRGGAAAGFGPALETTAFANPVEMVLLMNLRDPTAATEQLRNRFFIFAAGIVAGLLAIAVFWYITTRLILSPVRLLRGYAQRVSEGDLNIRSDINTGDEFEQLSDMFNEMLDAVRDKQQQLEAVNKSLDLKLGELAESNVALFEANKIKGEFLANVSHELRTPLNSIIGFAELMQETLEAESNTTDGKRTRYTRHIITSSRRLLDLINDLLDLAKIEAGRIELRVEPTSLRDMCEGLLNLIRPQAEQKQIALSLKVDAKLPLVHTDAGKLQQILFNFLSNAVKFTPEQGTVTLGVRMLPPATDDTEHRERVRIAVTDTGPGIAKADQQRIFEKFVQLDPSVTKAFGGTGLGLTISQELAAMLQARLEVDSDEGQGATFSVTLPLVLEQKHEPLMPEA